MISAVFTIDPSCPDFVGGRRKEHARACRVLDEILACELCLSIVARLMVLAPLRPESHRDVRRTSSSPDSPGRFSAGGIEGHDGEVDAFQCGLLVGKCPRARTARRMRAFTLSIALVEHTTRRISVSNARNGTNSAHAFSQSRTIAGYFVPHSH